MRLSVRSKELNDQIQYLMSITPDQKKSNPVMLLTSIRLSSHVMVILAGFILAFVMIYQCQGFMDCAGTRIASCVCSIQSVIRGISDIIEGTQSSQFDLLMRIQSYSCSQYVHLPEEFSFIYDEKREASKQIRRRRSVAIKRRLKRQISLGEPDPLVFQEAVAKFKAHALHQYVALGSSLKIDCLDTSVVSQEDLGSNVKYKWTHSDGSTVTTPQMTISRKTGRLTIPSAQLSDMDIYNCTVNYFEGDRSQETSMTFQHQIDVVSTPIFWNIALVHYTTSDCSKSETEELEKRISRWITLYVCLYCEIHSLSVTCIKTVGTLYADRSPNQIKILLALHFQGVEDRIAPLQETKLCELSCLEAIHLKISEILAMSLRSFFRVYIDGTNQYGEIRKHDPLVRKTAVEVISGCLSGFSETHKLCCRTKVIFSQVPCGVGEYGPRGGTECLPCQPSTYQPVPGGSACIICPHNYSTMDSGSISEADCMPLALIDSIIAARRNKLIMIICSSIGSIILIFGLLAYCLPAEWIKKFCNCNILLSTCAIGHCFRRRDKNYEEVPGHKRRSRKKASSHEYDMIETPEEDMTSESQMDELSVAKIVLDDKTEKNEANKKSNKKPGKGIPVQKHATAEIGTLTQPIPKETQPVPAKASNSTPVGVVAAARKKLFGKTEGMEFKPGVKNPTLIKNFKDSSSHKPSLKHGHSKDLKNLQKSKTTQTTSGKKPQVRGHPKFQPPPAPPVPPPLFSRRQR